MARKKQSRETAKRANKYVATSDDISERVRDLKPGDILQLDNGYFLDPIVLQGIRGTREKPITIYGSTECSG